MQDNIYMDNAATTKMYMEAKEKMLPFFEDGFGNPSAVYSKARKAQMALDVAREETAEILNARPNEIYFTSSGTESDNFALKGFLFAHPESHMVSSKIEHPAILNSIKSLINMGYKADLAGADKNGFIDMDEVKSLTNKDTRLISLMLANNEIGTIQNIEEISVFSRENNIILHTDAVQAAGLIDIDVKKLGADMLSLSAHKFHGPKGIGLLYIKDGTKVVPLIDGGAQERGRRAGTENVAYAVAMAEALKIAARNRAKNAEYIKGLRDRLIDGVLHKIPNTRLNGDREKRLANNASFCFENVPNEALLLRLDMENIAASAGSACSAGTLEASKVLLAIGLNEKDAKSSLRFSLSEFNTSDEVDKVIESLARNVKEIRKS